ncbi:hypothetical protein XK97_09205 [Obesumbacterium proteus]|uniref:hypothetical protein n=1 Tax=Obesumbacterium proteus TaxID=82983 RepID=UPI000621FA5C|nr:hypothetical protein [Obesumbacterium proteus]KKI47628.1 hypothetical protein XK97_09205 [Obesumbacterium proteus]
MYKNYPYTSKYSLFNKEGDSETTHSDFLTTLEVDFSDFKVNSVPDSVKPLRNKVEQIMGKEALNSIRKYERQQCMHFVHMMNMVSKSWNQTAGWWHTPFILDENKPLNTIEDYRHDSLIHRDLISCREMLDYRANILHPMYQIEKLIMDFMVYFPRSMYNFYDSEIKMYSGQYEAAIVLTHLIHQLNFVPEKSSIINGADEFCKKALINEAIKNANYFSQESEDFNRYDFEIADIDYNKLFDGECKYYDDNKLISIACEKLNFTLKDHSKLLLLIDAVIFIKSNDRKQPLFDGTQEQAFHRLKDEQYVRFSAICFLIKAEKEKLQFISKKTGANNKKVHVIKTLSTISRSLERAEKFEDKALTMLDNDYSFLKFVAYGLSAIQTAIEYNTPSKEGIKEYKKIRKFKWSLIAMLYTTIGHLPLADLKYKISVLHINIDKFIKSSQMMNVVKMNAKSEYLRMKETGEYDNL